MTRHPNVRYILAVSALVSLFVMVFPIASGQEQETFATEACKDIGGICWISPFNCGVVKPGTPLIVGCVVKITNFVLKIAFPIAVMVIIWAGFRFVFAMGNETKITEAKKTLLWAIIGFAVIAGALALATALQDFFVNIGS